MPNEELKSRLSELQQQLADSSVSEEDRNLLSNLMTDMVEIANGENPVEEAHQITIQEKLERYAGEFEHRHPTLAGVVRQVMDALGRMGV